MRYSMTFLESDFDALVKHLTSSANEEAAYLFARIVETPEECRLLVRAVIPVVPADIDSQSPVHLSIRSSSYVHAIKRSRTADAAFLFAHSHPGGPKAFSAQDDNEELELFQLVHERNPRLCHASLMLDGPSKALIGRVWLSDGSMHDIDLIRVMGERWRFLWRNAADTASELFHRQMLAFGTDVQGQLARMHVGVVGAGGTGSAVAEQLIRLGVGTLTVIDNDSFDQTNVNRVYGSGVGDQGQPKTAIVERQAGRTGTGTRVIPIPQHLSHKTVAKQLRGCDVIFGCTDDEWGRSILTRLALYYLIPVLDLGVVIDPELNLESIRSIQGRVTVLQPGYACLYCRHRISAKGVRDESISATDPERAVDLEAEGYLVGHEAPAPAVVSFTTATAAMATAEMLDRLIGYKHQDRKGTEYLYRFDADAIAPNTRAMSADCFCRNASLWGAGDLKLFLGITWRQT